MCTSALQPDLHVFMQKENNSTQTNSTESEIGSYLSSFIHGVLQLVNTSIQFIYVCKYVSK